MVSYQLNWNFNSLGNPFVVFSLLYWVWDFNRDRLLTMHKSAQMQMWAARNWIMPRCNDCHMCEVNAQCLTTHCEYMWETWEPSWCQRWKRPQRWLGQHLHLADGDTEGEQEPDFIPALYYHIYCFDFLSFLTYTHTDRHIYLNWENSIWSCMTLHALLGFFGSQFYCLYNGNHTWLTGLLLW